MATITANTPFNLSALDFSDLADDASFSGTSTLFKITQPGGYAATFTGTGFTYGLFGVPSGGTVNKLEISLNSSLLWSISGVSVAVTGIRDAVLSPSRTDDLQLLGNILSGNDTFIGSFGTDVFLGYAGNDTLNGNGGNDVLNGMSGLDTIFGGAGNDTIMGERGADKLYGGDGNDSIKGGLDNDTIMGDAGNDILAGEGGNDFIRGGLGDDIISGLIGNDTIYGDQGNDRIDGGLGNNKIFGGAGNDTIVSFTGTDTLFGDAGNDVLKGGAGVDVLNGGVGNDTLDGHVGKDRLTGGAGNDKFMFSVFSSPANVDTILDFSNRAGNDDAIVLSKSKFAKLALGALGAGNFAVGAPLDANDHIVYNQATGQLFYDGNGHIAGGASLIAVLTTKPVLTAADFFVVA